MAQNTEFVALPDDSDAAPPGRFAGPEWRKALLACLAFIFPFHWLSNFLLDVLPALVRVWWFGERLEFFRLLVSGGMAVAVPAGASATLPPVASAAQRYGLLETVALVAAVFLALAVLGRRQALLSGLAAGILAEAALEGRWVRLAFGQDLSAAVVSAAFCFLVVLTLGLRWMLSAFPARTFWARVATLFTCFVLPLGVLRAVQTLVGIRWFPAYWLALGLLPGTVAALLASLALRTRVAMPRPHPPPGWRLASYGLLFTALLASGIHWGAPALNGAFERSRQAANQAAVAALPETPSDAPYPEFFFQKGVNLTAEFPAPYDSAAAREMLESLRAYGVNAVALIPYGFAVRGEPHVRLNTGGGSWENDEGLMQLSRLAHARGIKVMLKPGVWVRGGFAGDLDFASARDRAVWFADYRVLLEHYARLATRMHADIFCVGGELSKLTPYEAEWRSLIARVRKLYPGPLVYAANFGTEFETLAFWDALDYIGLQEYYPLPDDLSTDELLRKVRAVEQRFQRPVIFTEAGFPSAQRANREPWAESHAAKVDLDGQARCYESILRAFYPQTWFEGMYWWAIRTNGAGGRDDTSLTPWGKPAMQVIKRWYTEQDH